MITVYLDSSMSYLCIGLSKDDVLLSSFQYDAWQRQSENLIPDLGKILAENKINVKNVDEIVVSIGPGSYTGTRIALTTAKIFAASTNCKIKTISTLLCLADGNKPSICLLDARSGRSYFAVYEGSKCIERDQILTNEEVNNYINNHPDFEVRGNLKYLGKEDTKCDIIKQMFLLRNELEVSEHPLSIKPAYLKE